MENNQVRQALPTGTAIRQVVTKSPVVVDEIRPDESGYSKSGLVAVMKQVITTKSWYPSKQVATNLSDNLFTAQEFGFAEQEFTSTETRVAFLDVPEKTTKEVIQARLIVNPNACIYRIMSNQPILTEGQHYAVDKNICDFDLFADAQVVRESEADHTGHRNLILDKNGKVQYRRVFFKLSTQNDMDYRTKESDDYYASDIVKMELQGASAVSSDQTMGG